MGKGQERIRVGSSRTSKKIMARQRRGVRPEHSTCRGSKGGPWLAAFTNSKARRTHNDRGGNGILQRSSASLNGPRCESRTEFEGSCAASLPVSALQVVPMCRRPSHASSSSSASSQLHSPPRRIGSETKAVVGAPCSGSGQRSPSAPPGPPSDNSLATRASAMASASVARAASGVSWGFRYRDDMPTRARSRAFRNDAMCLATARCGLRRPTSAFQPDAGRLAARADIAGDGSAGFRLCDRSMVEGCRAERIHINPLKNPFPFSLVDSRCPVPSAQSPLQRGH